MAPLKEKIMKEDRVLLDAGSGGEASRRMIAEIFLSRFNNEILASLDDAALLPDPGARISVSVDAYTVSPLFFNGASIGSLAINGTVNDVAMLGARPLWLSAAFIIEEGLPLATLAAVADDMAQACARANVKIVTGDTKVVPKGACDGVFITTTGIGKALVDPAPSGARARPGDAILLSGAVGDHGLAVMAARENLSFLSAARSDCAPLNQLVEKVLDAAGEVHVLRDPTRGGLATTLNEIATQSNVGVDISEAMIPINPAVKDGCSFLGLDPLYLANEGKCICILPEDQVERALAAMRATPEGSGACLIGHVSAKRPGKVVLRSRMGGERLLGMLEGAPVPRIC